MKEKLLNVMEEALELIKQCNCNDEIEKIRVQFLGKKGELTSILRSMGQLSEKE